MLKVGSLVKTGNTPSSLTIIVRIYEVGQFERFDLFMIKQQLISRMYLQSGFTVL